MRRRIRLVGLAATRLAIALGLAWMMVPDDASARVVAGKECAATPLTEGQPIDCQTDYGWAQNVTGPPEDPLLRLSSATDVLDSNQNGVQDGGECADNLNDDIQQVLGNAACTGAGCDETTGAGCSLPCIVCQSGVNTNDPVTGLTCPALPGDGTIVFVANECTLQDAELECQDVDPGEAVLLAVRDFTDYQGQSLQNEERDARPGSFQVCGEEGCPFVTIEKDCTPFEDTVECPAAITITVTNEAEGEGSAPATNCTVEDVLDPDGVPIPVVLNPPGNVPFDLAPGESRVFTAEVALENTTVNEARVVCDEAPDTCEPPESQTEDTDRDTCECQQGENYKCYTAKYDPRNRPPFQEIVVGLEDQFRESTARILVPYQLCNPVDKAREGEESGDGIDNPDGHLMCYKIADYGPRGRELVRVVDQFGSEDLLAANGRVLCLPALKNCEEPVDSETPPCSTQLVELERIINHYQCYDARTASGTEPLIEPGTSIPVVLTDQFEEEKATEVFRSHFLCNPTEKHFNGDPVLQQEPGELEVPDASAHLKCYDIRDADDEEPFGGATVTVLDQFGFKNLRAGRATQLCEDATKERLATPRRQ
jgi:hypothetical protein